MFSNFSIPVVVQGFNNIQLRALHPNPAKGTEFEVEVFPYFQDHEVSGAELLSVAWKLSNDAVLHWIERVHSLNTLAH